MWVLLDALLRAARSSDIFQVYTLKIISACRIEYVK